MKPITASCAVGAAACFAMMAPCAAAQRAPVTEDVQVMQLKQTKHPASADFSNVVVWLMPLDSQPGDTAAAAGAHDHAARQSI